MWKTWQPVENYPMKIAGYAVLNGHSLIRATWGMPRRAVENQVGGHGGAAAVGPDVERVRRLTGVPRLNLFAMA